MFNKSMKDNRINMKSQIFYTQQILLLIFSGFTKNILFIKYRITGGGRSI